MMQESSEQEESFEEPMSESAVTDGSAAMGESMTLCEGIQ